MTEKGRPMAIEDYRRLVRRLLKKTDPKKPVWYRYVREREKDAFGGPMIAVYGMITPVKAYPYHVLFRKKHGGVVSYLYPDALKILRND